MCWCHIPSEPMEMCCTSVTCHLPLDVLRRANRFTGVQQKAETHYPTSRRTFCALWRFSQTKTLVYRRNWLSLWLLTRQIVAWTVTRSISIFSKICQQTSRKRKKSKRESWIGSPWITWCSKMSCLWVNVCLYVASYPLTPYLLGTWWSYITQG